MSGTLNPKPRAIAPQTGATEVKTNELATTPPPCLQTRSSALPIANKPLSENCEKSQSIVNLPEEVKKNIVGYEDMELEELVLAILGQYQGHISVDRIILKLWGDYQKSPARAKVLARLRMLESESIISKQDGTKGNYKLNREE